MLWEKMNPEGSLRMAYRIKGMRQKIIVTHNPSEIDQNQLLLVRFPNLGSDDAIVPGMVNLKLAIKFERNEILSIDNFDVFACYRDLWKTKSEKRNAVRQRTISNDGCTSNCMKLRINAGDKDATNKRDVAIANAYENKFIILLDFEMLDSTIPY